MFIFLPLCFVFVGVTAQDFKKFDNENSFLVVLKQDDVASHSAARARCLQLGSDLAVIKSPEIQDFVLQLIRESNYESHNLNNRFRVGLTREGDGKVMWVDGTEVEDPSIWIILPQFQGENCGTISDPGSNNANTKYKSILSLYPCTDYAESYICHKSKAEANPTTTTTTTTATTTIATAPPISTDRTVSAGKTEAITDNNGKSLEQETEAKKDKATLTLVLFALGNVVASLLCAALYCLRGHPSTKGSRKMPADEPSAYTYSQYNDA